MGAADKGRRTCGEADAAAGPSFRRPSRITRTLVTLAAAVWLGASVEAADNRAELDSLLGAGDFWELTPDSFMARADGLGFRWVSAARDSGRSVTPGLTFRKRVVFEAVVRFSSNAVSSAMLSFFNRGDAGELDAQAFQSRVDSVTAELDALAGSRGRDVDTRRASTVNARVSALTWTKAPCTYVLEYAYSRIRDEQKGRRRVQPEYINLMILRSGTASARKPAGEQSVEIGKLALQKRVKRTAGGDVLIDSVPMVDQGAKGYCAVAAAERVMRYYGLDVNQHELAQRASTASSGGTDPDSLLKALKSMAGVLSVQVRTHEHLDFQEFQDMIQEYNRAARRKRIAGIELPSSGTIDVARTYSLMDKATFLASRALNPARSGRFSKTVQDQLNSGYPLLWGVTLGFVDETPGLPQASGGHMRLIIGYNARTSAILYTDSWGRGHELKRMNLRDAYAITTGLFSIEPR